MTSIQLDKAQVQKQLEQASPRNLFAININTSSQRAEVQRMLDNAIRDKRQITVCIIKQ